MSIDSISSTRSNIPLIKNFPLFNDLFQDPFIQFCFRGLDLNWKYSDVCPELQAGFNPFNSTIYFARKSAFADWFFSEDHDFSDFLSGEYVIHEMLFGIHDYLHIWSFHVLDHLSNGRINQLINSQKPLNEEDIEELVFIHLVSEAVATVGLDYWFLARKELWRVLSVGTEVSSLTVRFSEKHMDEFKKYDENFNPFTPNFLVEMIRFYCSGEFLGFDLESIQRSNIVFHWLKHEVKYGQTQRNHSYSWINYLFSDKPDYIVTSSVTTTVKLPERYESILTKLSQFLWDKVTGLENHFYPGNFRAGFRPQFRTNLDPKFSNPNSPTYKKIEDKWGRYEQTFFMANRDLLAEDHLRFGLISSILKSKSDGHPLTNYQLEILLNGHPKIETLGEEPEAIFVLP